MPLCKHLVRLPIGSIYDNVYYTNLLRRQLAWTRGTTIRFCTTPSHAKEKHIDSKGPPPPPCNIKDIQQHADTQFKSSTTLSSASKKNKEPVSLTPQAKLTSKQMRQNVEGYVFTRFFDYVKNYDKVLEKNFPSAVKVYRVFFDGVKDFYFDMKLYLKITRIANESPQGVRALNRKELELYTQMPRDMIKVAPALILSSLPMIGYAIFPLVLMFPRAFLTTHFWTLQQRIEFDQLALRDRLNHNRAVFRCLQAKLPTITENEHYAELQNVFGLLGSGFHPSVNKLLRVKDIFAKSPYDILSLSGRHLKLLCQVHGLKKGIFKRHRLREHAFLIHYMDLAINREGGVHNLPTDAMRRACLIRGLNPANLRYEEMVEWLRNWIQISTSLKEDHLTLFLHLPLFLGYNHPNNWQLIYDKKSKD